MEDQPPPLPAPPEGRYKSVLNLVVAIPMVLLALWLTVADFSYPGNLLFQDSLSIFVIGLFLGLASFGLVIFAVLPKRVMVTANLLLVSRIGMGWPLSLVTDHTFSCRLISLSFLILSIFYLACALRRLSPQLYLRPWLSWKHTMDTVWLWIGVGLVSVPIILLGYFEAGKSVMGSYVRFSWSGISLVERILVKENHRVHLIGMMHIGDGSFYQELNQRMYAFPEQGRRLVLTEGVADSQDLLPAEFKSGELYANLAKSLGLEPQSKPVELENPQVGRKRNFDVPGISFRNADIDISDLEEDQVKDLVSVLKFLASLGSPEILLNEAEGVSGRDMEILFFDVLLGQRNDVLMEHFDESASEYAEVFIPWGAAHLPDIETRLLEQGYSEQLEVVRPIVRFWD